MKANFTKKIVLATVILLGFYTGAKAQGDDQSAYDDQYNQPQTQYAQPQQQYTEQQPQQYTQQQPQYAPADQQGFDYYPDANVYYDNSCNSYVYNNGYGWVTVNILPVGISLYGMPHYRVFHRGPQVWLDNAIHIRNFRGGNYYRGGGRPVVFNGGGYRGGGRVAFNGGNHGGFNGGGRGGFNGGNHGGGGFGGGRQAHYRR